MTELKNTDILTGGVAESVLENILQDKEDMNTENYPAPFVEGYYKEGDKWIAFDNTNGDCWTEEFDTKEQAIAWINGEEE